ncbi:MAG: hypothetical protein KGD58_00795 [Candidatus Lokiarchaeota archaeon]|nr:hypothetical protein [Candidatus Lokiarchaeota archaeon]
MKRPMDAMSPTTSEIVILIRLAIRGISIRSQRGGNTIRLIGIERRLDAAIANKIKAIFFFFMRYFP